MEVCENLMKLAHLGRISLKSELNIRVAKYIYIYKIKWSRYRPGVAQKVGRGTALLFHDRGTRGE